MPRDFPTAIGSIQSAIKSCVGAIVQRYKNHVLYWEVWNEPRTGRGEGAAVYAEFAARTASLMFPAGGAFDVVFTEQMLTWLRDQDKLSPVDEIVYHPYAYNPDESYERVEGLRQLVRSFSDRIRLRHATIAGSVLAEPKPYWLCCVTFA